MGDDWRTPRNPPQGSKVRQLAAFFNQSDGSRPGNSRGYRQQSGPGQGDRSRQRAGPSREDSGRGYRQQSGPGQGDRSRQRAGPSREDSGRGYRQQSGPGQRDRSRQQAGPSREDSGRGYRQQSGSGQGDRSRQQAGPSREDSGRGYRQQSGPGQRDRSRQRSSPSPQSRHSEELSLSFDFDSSGQGSSPSPQGRRSGGRGSSYESSGQRSSHSPQGRRSGGRGSSFESRLPSRTPSFEDIRESSPHDDYWYHVSGDRRRKHEQGRLRDEEFYKLWYDHNKDKVFDFETFQIAIPYMVQDHFLPITLDGEHNGKVLAKALREYVAYLKEQTKTAWHLRSFPPSPPGDHSISWGSPENSSYQTPMRGDSMRGGELHPPRRWRAGRLNYIMGPLSPSQRQAFQDRRSQAQAASAAEGQSAAAEGGPEEYYETPQTSRSPGRRGWFQRWRKPKRK